MNEDERKFIIGEDTENPITGDSVIEILSNEERIKLLEGIIKEHVE